MVPLRFASARRMARLGRRRTAFTMVEAVFSILLVSGLFLAALNTAGASSVAQSKLGDHGRGHMLALDLLGEILLQGYVEPTETPTFGAEASENTGTRLAFDDIDDYRNFSESPPKYKNGSAIAGFTGWSRSVFVEKVLATNLAQTSAAETGVRRIVVTVTRNGVTAATLTAARADKQP